MRITGILRAGHLRTCARVVFLATLAVPTWCESARAAEPWLVPAASLRFTLNLTTRPTHGSAGYFVQLPDGGLLPGTYTTVYVSGVAGKGLASYALWHSKSDGLSLVFADPGEKVKSVDIYVSGGKQNLWTPASELTPSSILCTKPGKADLLAAQNLARMGEIKPPYSVINKAGIKRAPFSIGGDESGRPRPASFYFLTHVDVTDPGNTWIAPFTVDGESEVRIDGKKLTPKERIDKWGGTGEYFDLTKGIHRVEVFQTAPGEGPYASEGREAGLMYLTWRTPNAKMEELGGVRSNKLPMPGTSRMETRVIKDKEIVRSGSAELASAVTKSGGPVACVQAQPTHTIWFEGEIPLIVYDLKALATGNPPETTYLWDLPGGAHAEGPVIHWVFPGFFDNSVTLTTKYGASITKATETFYGFCPGSASMENPADRKAFRDALTTMVKSYPLNPDPVALWNPAIWNNLIRTTEEGQGYDLLRTLFTTRVDTLRKALTPAQFSMLQDVFLDMLQQRDPSAALKLIDTFQTSFGEGSLRDNLLIRKAEIYMYYLHDIDAASRGLAVFSERKGDIAEWARIRQGDIAFLAGDLNKATELYASVQKNARGQRNQLDQVVTQELLKNGNPTTPKSEGSTIDRTENKPPEVLPYNGSNWRAGALREVSNSENIATLLDSGYLLEAREALRNWQRQYPLSKISGDLLLMEARFSMKLGDWKRARVMLEAYCREVDASSFLPEAARSLMTCVQEMKAPHQEVRDVLEKVAKRLKYHPVAKELEDFLSSGK